MACSASNAYPVSPDCAVDTNDGERRLDGMRLLLWFLCPEQLQASLQLLKWPEMQAAEMAIQEKATARVEEAKHKFNIKRQRTQ